MAMTTFVLCLASNHRVATTILDDLKAADFAPHDVSVLYPDPATSQDFVKEMNRTMPEVATAAAPAGGILGGALGWLVVIGALAIPGVGPIIAAGPILAVLSGAARGAAFAGVAGGLIGLGVPEIEAKRYAGKLGDERILIVVASTNIDRVSRVKKIFRNAGADDIEVVTGTTVPQKDEAKQMVKGRASARQPSYVEQYGNSV
jgi:hypothetical protein